MDTDKQFTFDEYQGIAHKTNLRRGDVLYHSLALVGEIGEMLAALRSESTLMNQLITRFCILSLEMGEVSKLIRDQGVSFDYEVDLYTYDVNPEKELGDILYHLSELCDAHQYTLAYIAALNNKKLLARLEKGTLQGSGNDR